MKLLLAGLVALALAAPATVALAEDAAPAPAAAAAPAKPSVDTTPIADLLANPDTKAVLDKDMPGLSTHPQLEQVKGMTLREISKFPEAQLDDTRLAAIQSDLDAAGSH